MKYKTAAELKKEEKKEQEKFEFKCKCGIIEKEKERVYDLGKEKVCVKCYLDMI